MVLAERPCGLASRNYESDDQAEKHNSVPASQPMMADDMSEHVPHNEHSRPEPASPPVEKLIDGDSRDIPDATLDNGTDSTKTIPEVVKSKRVRRAPKVYIPEDGSWVQQSL